MDERKELNAALPGDMPAAEPGADAAPKGAKKYVKPAMKVFKLDCGLLVGSGTPIQVTITGGFDYYYGEALRVAPIRDLVCDDFKAPLFLSRYSRICGCGYLFECSQVYTCYSPRLAPSVQFGAGVPADWEVDDFLANVQFTEGCDGTLAEPGTDPESYGARYATTVYPVTGIYRGRSVAITLKLIPGGYGTFVCPDC